MKALKIVLILALLVVPASGTISASGLTIEARGTFFMPTDETFRDVYGSGPSWGGELGFRISDRLTVWAGGDYFSASGKLVFTEDETKIRIVPLSAGAKYFPVSGVVSPYVGAGVGYFQYQETNSIGTVEKGAVGLVARLGLLIKLGPAFFADVQGGWTTCSVQPLEVQANLGGFSAGLGLGFEF